MNFQTVSLKRPRPYRHFTYNPEPAEWGVFDHFDWTGPVVIDVGAGDGEWVTHQASVLPQTSFIAIERGKNRYKSLRKNVLAARLPNIFAVRADAIALIQQKILPHLADEIYFFYPNPMPKKRQANRRYFVGPHFAVFHCALKENGGLYMASNIKESVDEAREYLAKIWQYEIEVCGKVNAGIPPRTAFERKYMGRGGDVYEIKAIKCPVPSQIILRHSAASK